jgi:hypothetical protein
MVKMGVKRMRTLMDLLPLPPTTKIHTLLDIKKLQSVWVAYSAAYVVVNCVTAHTYHV